MQCGYSILPKTQLSKLCGDGKLERVDLLYDHYKETMNLSLDAQKKRGMLFISLCIFELLNSLMPIFSNEIALGISDYIYSQFKMAFNISVSLVQSVFWIIIVYILVRYFQTNIYIERQYGYIAILEEKISKEIDESCFYRESKNYLDKYPKVLDVIAFFYTWCIPALIVVVNVYIIIFQWKNKLDIYYMLFDSICCLFSMILTVLYLCMMHPRKYKKHSNYGQRM